MDNLRHSLERYNTFRGGVLLGVMLILWTYVAASELQDRTRNWVTRLNIVQAICAGHLSDAVDLVQGVAPTN